MSVTNLTKIVKMWPSDELGELIQILTNLKKEVQNTKLLNDFNEIFGTSINCPSDILSGCESIRHYKGTFEFCATRENNWESYIWVKYDDRLHPIDVIFQTDRYFRWSFKDHGYDSTGAFQGMTLNEYLYGDEILVRNRRQQIENDVAICRSLSDELFKI